jgi:NADPH:quinone reductase-like Zn-dependent oxidoreductase
MKMKAAVYTRYGSPDVVEIKEVEKPFLSNNQVLVKVNASSVNVEDLDYLKGTAWSIRMVGLLKPRYKILGFDVAGKIEKTGKNVTEFHVGDEVMGNLFGYGFGAFAEYVCAPEKAFVLKPPSLTFEQAAAVPSRAILALQGLQVKRQLQQGQKVLINGAGGGVGPFAMQLVKHFEAEVTAVDHTKKLDMLRSLGADHVIDYTKEDFTKNGQQYDLIFDIAGYHSILDYKRALKPNGTYTIIGGSRSTIFQALFIGPLISITGTKKMGIIGWRPNKREDLKLITELIEAGKLVPVIDRYYNLDDIDEAFLYFEKGHPQGKIIINIESQNCS